MKQQIPEYTNSQMNGLIDEHIHNIRNRAILKLRYLDGMTYERIAEEMDMSRQKIERMVREMESI